MNCLFNSNIVKEKRFRIVGAIILSVFVITVIVVCSIVFMSGGNETKPPDVPRSNNSTNASSSYTRALVAQLDNSDLSALDIDTKNSSFIIKNWKNQVHSFDCYMKETIYIGSRDPGNSIESSSGQYSGLSQPSNWVADKIAVDHVNRKVYVLDVAASNINIFDALGEHYNVVMSHLRGPKDIAVDSIKRLIFVLLSSSIITASIDGSSPKSIVDTTALSSFTIDHEEKIYYADLKNINSVNYAGQEHQIILKISNEVSSIAALKNNLFWVYRSYESDDSVLNSCEIVDSRCVSVSRIPFAETLMQIKAYNFEEIPISNPCNSKDHGCDHMCIMNSAGSSSCACSIGWQLDTDLKSCKEADEFLLYVEGNYVKSHILDNKPESFTKAMLPLKLNISFSAICNFDFDVQKRTLIFSDGWDMYQVVLDTNSKQNKIGSDKTPELTIPAIDWISKNLYYTSVEIFTESDFTWYYTFIKAHQIKLSEPYENDKIITSVYETDNVTSLVIHPNRGVLFYATTWTTVILEHTKIHKINLDGTLHSDYGENTSMSISKDMNVLGIDCVDDRLYWFSDDKKTIYLANLDGIDVKSINISSINNPTMLSIYNNWLYVSTATSIWRLDKLTGGNVIKVLPKFQEEYQRIFGVKVFSKTVQRVDESHPCAVNNGDCQQYCFGVPSNGKILQRVCGCRKNEELNSDGKTCYKL